MRHITLQRPFTHRSTSNPRRFSGQSAAQADSLTYSHTGLLRAYPDHRPRRADSLTCSPPDLCAPPDNQLPRTDPLACSFTGPLCASSPTDYPGSQAPVAGRQHLIAPDHSACRRPGSARHRLFTRPAPQRSGTPIVSSHPSASPEPSSPQGGDVGTPTCQRIFLYSALSHIHLSLR